MVNQPDDDDDDVGSDLRIDAGASSQALDGDAAPAAPDHDCPAASDPVTVVDDEVATIAPCGPTERSTTCQQAPSITKPRPISYSASWADSAASAKQPSRATVRTFA
jgi:hypothetical protein